ncbi:MAG TPA: dephospho-CoA kinase [Planctomycetes bacterium]|nr:dephospho-CoA kinase [Planctomycetota bacterium]
MSTSEPSPTLVLGVVGGIASGKSYVARALAGTDGMLIDADRIAHEVLASPEGAAFCRERFGERRPDVLGPDSLPSRQVLAELCFDPRDGEANRRALEGWIHPRVRERIRASSSAARRAGLRVLVLDVPLLLENNSQHGLADACDRIVFVDADEQVRDARARATRGWTAGELARREAAQLPLAEKRRRADHVLSNHGTLEDLDRKIAALRAELGLG